jgi:protein TonB
MRHALAAPALVASLPSSTLRRSAQLAAALALHAALFAWTLAPHSVEIPTMDTPLIVDFIQPVDNKPQVSKPVPVVRPQPITPKPIARPEPTPVIEATRSTLASDQAVDTPPPPESKPTPPAAPTDMPVVQARFDADYLRNPAPPYPPMARRNGEEGKVVLRVMVSPNGTAEHVEIKSSSGSSRLDEAALKTIYRWKFVAARRGDVPVASAVLVPIIFKLEQ